MRLLQVMDFLLGGNLRVVMLLFELLTLVKVGNFDTCRLFTLHLNRLVEPVYLRVEFFLSDAVFGTLVVMLTRERPDIHMKFVASLLGLR